MFLRQAKQQIGAWVAFGMLRVAKAGDRFFVSAQGNEFFFGDVRGGY